MNTNIEGAAPAVPPNLPGPLAQQFAQDDDLLNRWQEITGGE